MSIRVAALALVALLAACGARSSLEIRTIATSDAGAGDVATVDVDAGPTCNPADLSTWRIERYRDFGDYERTAVAISGAPWVALKVHGGNIALVNLGVSNQGIALGDRIDIADSPVYPVALDVDDRRFVMLTTSGINWNGDITLWRIDRIDGTVMRIPIGPPADASFTVYSALGLAGDDVVLAYSRPGVSETQGTIELRSDQLALVQTLSVAEVAFTTVRPSATATDIYAGATTRVRAEASTLTTQPAIPDWEVIGGIDGFLVEMGDDIRLTHGADTWNAAWPHTQFSPPAVVRTHGGAAAFTLETELTAVIGHVTPAGLEWLPIASGPGAPGIGVGLFPVIEDGRLGLFYLGIEIPSPEQPLRYFGLACP